MKWFGKEKTLRRKIAPAKIGLTAFLLFCVGVLVWDIAQNGWTGSLTAEQPVANLDADQIPEPALEVAAEAQDDTEAAAVTEETEDSLESMFAAYRMDREESRNEELALLQTIIDDEGGSPAIRAEAEQRRLTIAQNMENEIRAESLLAAKDFGETVVLVGTDQATVICAVELDAVKATQIAEIVSEACDVGFENVVIVNK